MGVFPVGSWLENAVVGAEISTRISIRTANYHPCADLLVNATAAAHRTKIVPNDKEENTAGMIEEMLIESSTMTVEIAEIRTQTKRTRSKAEDS